MTSDEKLILRDIAEETERSRSLVEEEKREVVHRRRERLQHLESDNAEIEANFPVNPSEGQITGCERDSSGLREKKGMSLLSSLIGLTPKVGPKIHEKMELSFHSCNSNSYGELSLSEKDNAPHLHENHGSTNASYLNEKWAIPPPSSLTDNPRSSEDVDFFLKSNPSEFLQSQQPFAPSPDAPSYYPSPNINLMAPPMFIIPPPPSVIKPQPPAPRVDNEMGKKICSKEK